MAVAALLVGSAQALLNLGALLVISRQGLPGEEQLYGLDVLARAHEHLSELDADGVAGGGAVVGHELGLLQEPERPAVVRDGVVVGVLVAGVARGHQGVSKATVGIVPLDAVVGQERRGPSRALTQGLL